MSIDMTTVKQIMHNNKEVSKIEDSLGRILWQKPAPVVRNKLYYINGTTVDEYDFENKTITNYIAKSGSVNAQLNGSFIFGYNGELYGGPNNTPSYCFKLELDTVNHEYKWTDVTGTLPGINGNQAVQDGNDIIWTPNTSTGSIYDWLDNNNVIGTFGGTSGGAGGNNMLQYNNKIYAWTTSSTGAYIYEYNNGTFTQANITVPYSGAPAYNAWFLNGTMYYKADREYDPNTNTWIIKRWTGLTNFNGSRVFTDGVDVYQVGGTGTNKNIYKLDVATSTWSVYWTVPTAIRGDYFINSKGTAQLGQNLRPRN